MFGSFMTDDGMILLNLEKIVWVVPNGDMQSKVVVECGGKTCCIIVNTSFEDFIEHLEELTDGEDFDD